VALLVPLLEQWYIKTEALSFLYDYDVMVIISINFRTGNTVSLLTFFIGENKMKTKMKISIYIQAVMSSTITEILRTTWNYQLSWEINLIQSIQKKAKRTLLSK
jgi:hypothetical protein